MIGSLSSWAVRHRLPVTVALLVLATGATLFARRLPLDALPDLTSNQCIVLTRAPGLSPEEVEQWVTRPVELALMGLPGTEETRSLSRYGISAVTVVFEDAVDAWRARQMVAERLASADLPSGIDTPELAPLTGGLGEIVHLSLSSSARSPAELLELVELRLAPLLKAVPGVVEVNSWGGAQRTFDVVANPLSLGARGIDLETLHRALEHASSTAADGALADDDAQVLLRTQTRPQQLRDLRDATLPGGTARVGDVAQVRQGTRLRLGAATQDGQGEVVYVMAQMLRDENALEVTQRIHERMPAIRAALPADITLTTVYDRSDLVGRTLRTVAKNLLEGFALVSLVLLAFLGSWRAGLIVASVIPLSMAFATAVMAWLGLPGNLMSLGALDFGLLVDGAVVMTEGVFHGARHLRTEHAWHDHVRDTARRAARPVVLSVLMIMLVYVPVLAMTGTDGKLFRPMAITVVLALLFSLALALTWVPAACALWLRAEHVPSREPMLVRVLSRSYQRVLRFMLPRRLLVTALTLILLASGVVVFRGLGIELTPQLDEGDLVIQTTHEPEIRLEASVERALELERVLRAEFPEITRVVSRIGSPAVATDIMGLEQADVFVGLKPREQWRAGMDRAELVARMSRRLSEGGLGGELSFTQPIQMRFNELLGGAVTDVAVSIYGPDLVALLQHAGSLSGLLQRVAGAEDVRVLSPPEVPITTVLPNALAAAQVGLSVQDVSRGVQALQVGIDAGETLIDGVRIPIRMLLDHDGQARHLAQATLPLPNGGVVPLSRVVRIEQGRAPGLVNRRNAQRRIVVGFNVRNADLAGVVQAAQTRAEAELKLPAGYRLEWGGQYESLTEAAARLSWIVPLVLVLILALLVAAFGSVRPALGVFSVVPVAAVGGIFALALRHTPVSLPAAIGFIALSGIAVMNGVVWMAHALELEQKLTDPSRVAFTAAMERMRPVLMTALVAAFGFIPMMLSTGDGAEVQRPLASVVVGGLLTSSWLTLGVLPVLYAWLRPTPLTPMQTARTPSPVATNPTEDP